MREAATLPPITRRHVACFDYGADLAYHALPLCGAIPEASERRAHEVGYNVGLEMARQAVRDRKHTHGGDHGKD
jgi:hypothetical protein